MRLPELPPSIKGNYEYGEILDELVKIGKFRLFIDYNEIDYPYWDKWKYLAKDWNIDAEKLWYAVKVKRSGQRLTVLPGYQFHINTPSTIQEDTHYFDMNLGGVLQSEGIIPDDDKERYLLSSLMEEAIASSQLEGAVTTRELAREMLESSRKPRNHSEQMIVNNYEAMQWIVENKGLHFTAENIQKLHGIITRNTLQSNSEEGAFRHKNEVNVVDAQTNEIVYTPPNYEHINALMNGFCLFANDKQNDRHFIHPVVKGILLHFFMGFIHPFTDGNGRTARTLFYWYLLKKGYWLIEYMSVSRIVLRAKAQYAKAYLHTEFDGNDLTYFVLYNIKCIKTALEDLKKYIQRKQAEKKQIFSLLRDTNFNTRQMALLQEWMQDSNRFFSASQVEKLFAVSNQTARNDLNGLEAAGLLEHRKAGKTIHFFSVKDFGEKLVKLTGSKINK